MLQFKRRRFFTCDQWGPLFAFLCVFTFMASSPASAVHVTGDLIGIDKSNNGLLLYRFERRQEKKGDERRVKVWFRNPDGTNAMTEEAVYKNNRLTQYLFNQHQTKTFADIRFTEKEIQYKLKKWGDEKKRIENLDPNTLVVDQLEPFIQKRWEKLQTQPVFFRYVVPYRMETINFKFVKVKDLSHHGKPAVKFLMKPKSPFISMMVDDIYFTFERDGRRRLIQTTGQFALREKIDGTWKPVIGRLMLKYKK